MSTVCRPDELFTLDMLADHLLGFRPPQGPHDPAGDWKLDYGMYCLAGLRGFGSRIGTVRVSRRRRDAGQFTMRVECAKRATRAGMARLAAQIRARSDRLPVPLDWSWQGEIVDARGDVVPGTRLKRSAALRGNVLELAGGRRRQTINGPCTLHWLLWEAVGRLPAEAFPTLEFTLIDDLDQPKAAHKLRYARTLSVMLGERRVRQTRVEELEKGRIHKTIWTRIGGQPIRLRVYHHLGDGSVPWVYWVDDRGRLLFAVSGLEAYVLDHFAKS
jgi:hypothetical protein